MTDTELRATVLRVLGEVAPDADLEALQGDASIPETLDVDSMDMQDFLAGVSEATGVEIPQRDYGDLTSVDACVEYLSRARAAT